MTTILSSLESVKAQIRQSATDAGRGIHDIALIAVSKTQEEAALRAALTVGQRVFGENRVQEAQRKWPALRADYPDLRLHLIGPLQTNKTKAAVALFDVIHTLDRLALAESLATEFARANRSLPCYIQVNTGDEAQKSGIPPQEADVFIEHCQHQLQLPIIGLMCIPPATEDAAPHFALLADLAARHHLPRLSMGMSRDYPLAIRFGATDVRVGSAIFGER